MTALLINNHVIAGSSLFVGVLLGTIVHYRRLLQLASAEAAAGTDRSFLVTEYAHRYFPEPNLRLLKGVGGMAMAFAVLGYLLLMSKEAHTQHTTFSLFNGDSFHFMMYALYFTTGSTWVLEGYQLVPPDASRLSLAFSQALECLLLVIHAQMKPTDVQQMQHRLQVLTVFLSSAGLFGSILYKECITPWIVFLGASLWQALWVVSIGLMPSTVKNMDVPVYFCLVGMLLFYTGLLAAIYLKRVIAAAASSERNHQESGRGGSSFVYERAAMLQSSKEREEYDEDYEDNNSNDHQKGIFG